LYYGSRAGLSPGPLYLRQTLRPFRGKSSPPGGRLLRTAG
jgi:hypothetical protein